MSYWALIVLHSDRRVMMDKSRLAHYPLNVSFKWNVIGFVKLVGIRIISG